MKGVLEFILRRLPAKRNCRRLFRSRLRRVLEPRFCFGKEPDRAFLLILKTEDGRFLILGMSVVRVSTGSYLGAVPVHVDPIFDTIIKQKMKEGENDYIYDDLSLRVVLKHSPILFGIVFSYFQGGPSTLNLFMASEHSYKDPYSRTQLNQEYGAETIVTIFQRLFPEALVRLVPFYESGKFLGIV